MRFTDTWKKSGRFVVLGAAAAFLYFLFAGKNTIIDVYRSYRDLRSQRREVVRLERINDSLKVEIDKLKNDTAYIEKIAREKLGMARRSETVYKFIEENE